ncbi:endoribonuclease Dicer homolog 2-like isoform X2 [Lotus japonicus]|uniref:endoribonuclease Dicer homolog 2-like isoform X2 n=1 Tax=Lotus japonicus TaxID=34305 RepID=UPI00258E858E|nr:endoribonuclease Dicer homolog 2-like isoform X2 [Lotus japonicus]
MVEEALPMELDNQVVPDALPFARSYQIEALDKAIRENTIVFLDTGSGKTLIAIMLLRSYAYRLRKPSTSVAVFLVPTVVLVSQQAKALEAHTDLKVGMYYGDMGVDFWDAATWKQQIEKQEVLVMTPQILLDCLRHSFIKLQMIKVLILDECHHTKGRHPYSRIMTEFYHHQLQSGISDLPRIFGMTASPVKSKAGNSELTMSKYIRDLMTLMHSKVYTCTSEAVIREFMPISTPKFKFYEANALGIVFEELAIKLKKLKEQHELFLRSTDFTKSATEYAEKRITKFFCSLMYCLEDLGVWLAFKAAESLSSNETGPLSCGNSANKTVKMFCLATVQELKTYLLSGPQRSISDNMKHDVETGLLTSKVFCLIDTLLEYRDLTDLRCIVFVERVITAIVLPTLLNAVLPKYNSWKTKFVAGNNCGLQSQSKKVHDGIVDDFRKGLVNIIVATSILEEGIDVKSCNLVIRFDPCHNVCSFIQSRGRARMPHSDYILMVKSGDSVTCSRLEKYLSSGDIMRKESLRHSSLPCDPLESDLFHEETYRVESTGAIVNLISSIGLLHLYCSRLPADGYFKPTPRWDKDTGTLYLPKSCPLPAISVQGDRKMLKNIACLEACKQLHKIGALTDKLVPDIVVEEQEVEEFGSEPYDEKQPSYVPRELVNQVLKHGETTYHCYLIELKQNFSYDITVQNIYLATRVELNREIASMQFDMGFDKGSLSVSFIHKGAIHLSPDMVSLCKRFQVTILRILLDHNMDRLQTALEKCCLEDGLEIDYLLLPSMVNEQGPTIDWLTVNSVNSSKIGCQDHTPNIQTKDGLVCRCIIQNSLVCTPHNGYIYITTGMMNLDGTSPLKLKSGEVITYKNYFKKNHGTQLYFEHQRLLKAKRIFQVKNYCHGPKQEKDREASKTFVELPPELCCVIMSPISDITIYSFSFIPSIMHRLESLLVAVNLKMHMGSRWLNEIHALKVLEAITTKRCKETFHYESLETLGDSFLKYAVTQHLFQAYQNHHEGLLTLKRVKIISNAALCKLGCSCGLPGFIRNEPFDPNTWIVPGDKSGGLKLKELVSDGTKVYFSGMRNLKRKIIADVVEALIGAFLISGGENAALLFMDWVGIKVCFDIIPYERHFSTCVEKLVHISLLESKLKYSFRDSSLLVEALTHGSYMLPEVPTCYQRLEFLGDSILDYLITVHMYEKYPGMSPGQLTDMRAASVNNDCYAWSAIKAGLHKHILHVSQDLHKHITEALENFYRLSSSSTFGWDIDMETPFPKVLGDIIESLAGAILVDSGYNKEAVWKSIRPLLEPLVTPETFKLHPVAELHILCQRRNYTMNKKLYREDGGDLNCIIKVETDDGVIHQHKYRGPADRKTAQKLVSKEILKSLKQ